MTLVPTIKITNLPVANSVSVDDKLFSVNLNTNITQLVSIANLTSYISNTAALLASNNAMNIANTGYIMANNAYIQANLAILVANTANNHAANASSIAISAYAQANTANNHAANSSTIAVLAYAKANNALANTGGDVSGTIILTGTANVVSNGTGTFGYMSGAGGSVIQGVNKVTGVTLNKPTGTITTNNQILQANTANTFILSNSLITAGDIIVLNHSSKGTLGGYLVSGNCVSGASNINIRNVYGSALGEAINVSFILIKSTQV